MYAVEGKNHAAKFVTDMDERRIYMTVHADDYNLSSFIAADANQDAIKLWVLNMFSEISKKNHLSQEAIQDLIDLGMMIRV